MSARGAGKFIFDQNRLSTPGSTGTGYLGQISRDINVMVIQHFLGTRSQKAKFAPFSEDDERLLTDLNVYDLQLEAEAARLHALDVESLEQLQRHYPQALASPAPRGDSCCGSSCIRGGGEAQST